MRISNGWLKLHRSLLNSWISKDTLTLSLFIRLLLSANFKDSKMVRNGKMVTIKRGQVVTSLHELALGCCRKSISSRMQLLEDDGVILQQRDHRGTIVTICNYDRYQGVDDDEGTAEVTTEDTTTPQQKGHVLRIKRKGERKKEHLPKSPTSVEKDPSPGSLVWDAYEKAMVSVTGQSPPRNAKTNSQCKRLVDLLGLELALGVATIYPGFPDRFYGTNCYSLDLLLRDYAKLALAYKQRFGTAGELS